MRVMMRVIRWALLGMGCLVGLAAFSACGSSTSARTALPTATKGDIVLTTDETSYSVSQPIGVTLQNTSGTTYYAVDGHAGCTYLTLQQLQWDNKTWKDVSICGQSMTAQPLVISGKVTEPFTLTPGSAQNQNTWQPGSYRVAVAASTSPSAKAKMVYSGGFTIHS